ncbi:Streptothricin acetyltransferase [Pediococcus damnosus]|uniref:Streptothricin acetyltransferase n=1 Tax=Pediococcus damnosus TaxID=51663 RepID=A0A0R2HQZ6_9LACO|nr:GNAT family N-acetyltransferase [Pediococcus damnosus]AMV60297.1 Streptothricin acetyltransferase [Pediococcus damnosus]AMV62827.1 Streptothricin acetyltransferase [Pediococcus damnosus]AMV64547.1 Streptothricin acetyltransferase [Pediococcus damnosus]AMV67288.1 Streptothricin acetyltransferase [Pediococcus damnosus]AMV69590.1 Streptothricin acetyltransferase [Pediococcus damnosus]
MIEIVGLTKENMADWDVSNTPFELTGRVIPTLKGGKWTVTEEPFAVAKKTKFPSEKPDETYLTDPQKQLYFAYLDGKNVGQIRMFRNWNKFCYIENIAIKAGHRHAGIGQQLFAAAEKWARENDYVGIQLEAQDDNLNACQFYQKRGLQLGGVDTLFYTANPNISVALQWYKIF